NSGTATAADGSGSVSFGVSTVGSNRTCIVKVNVTATSPGTKTNTVTLSFLGGSDTKTATLTVTPAASTTTLTSSLNPSQVGQPVTFTATVTGSSPTGT